MSIIIAPPPWNYNPPLWFNYHVGSIGYLTTELGGGGYNGKDPGYVPRLMSHPEVTSDQTIPIRNWPLIIPSPDRSDLWSYYCAVEPNPRPCNYGLGTHRVRWTWSDQRSLPDGTSIWVEFGHLFRQLQSMFHYIVNLYVKILGFILFRPQCYFLWPPVANLCCYIARYFVIK